MRCSRFKDSDVFKSKMSQVSELFKVLGEKWLIRLFQGLRGFH